MGKIYNKTLIIFLHDAMMVLAAWIFAYFLRFGFPLYHDQSLQAIQTLYLLFPIQLFFNFYFGLYLGVWRFASIPDLVRIVKAVVVGCVVTVGVLFVFNRLEGIPRTIFPIYGVLLIGLLNASRLCYRCLKDRHNSHHKNERTLIIGAGNAGEILSRNLLHATDHKYRVVAFVDDDHNKLGKEIHGIRILGICADIGKIVKTKNISFAIIAIPSATAAEMQKIVSYCRDAGIRFKTLPSLGELVSNDVNINTIREVALKDLLGREEVSIDFDAVRNSIENKAILISGGGGSIGSAICRKVARLNPKVLAIIDISEINIFNITREMSASFPNVNFIPYLGSVADEVLVNQALNHVRPEIIFHAAAYKHVPILEKQIYSAVYNNIVGTKVFVDLAEKALVKKFILISSDKAVNPSSFMGATKRVAELICQHKHSGHEKNNTKFIIVRFGNVLGSSGSVVPIFEQQAANGGPITVTHPEMTRFFMTIPEAARLILQACVLGDGGETFVLDMGKPVHIRCLAEQIIHLLGKKIGVDVDIVYSGLRPGEKLHEELFYKDEQVMPTKCPKIMQAKMSNICCDIERKIEHAKKLLQRCSEHELREFVNALANFSQNENVLSTE